MPDGGLLAVHAHPDDETLSTGALLATWAAAGRPVTVVTCTRGERGEVIAHPGTTSEGLAVLEGDGPALAAHRECELARATAALGVNQVFLDHVTPAAVLVPVPADGERYEDSGMEWVRPGVAGPAADSPATAFARVPLDEAAARLADVIAEQRPEVVATYEPGGGYGHPDHVRAHDITVRALELLVEYGRSTPPERAGGTRSVAGTGSAAGGGRPAGESPGLPELLPGVPELPPDLPELWQAVAPADEVRAARRALAGSHEARAAAVGHSLEMPDPDAVLPPFAKEELAAPGTRLERVAVAPVLDRVLPAMRAHATQIQHATHAPAPGILGFYALSNGVLAPVMEYETYVVAPRMS